MNKEITELCHTINAVIGMINSINTSKDTYVECHGILASLWERDQFDGVNLLNNIRFEYPYSRSFPEVERAEFDEGLPTFLNMLYEVRGYAIAKKESLEEFNAINW